MFWYVVLGAGAVSALFAASRGHSPLRWFFTSALGLPILKVMPPASGKTVAERSRARRQVGDTVGLWTGAAVTGTLGLLHLLGLV
jgi:hypothetical protein